MYNYVNLIGRLVRDPEHRLTSTGIAVTRFTLAINRIRSQSDEADFIRIVTWRRLAEIASQYLKKGKLVAIEGRLQVESYVKDGEEKFFYDVVADNMQMLDRASQSADSFADSALAH